MSAVRFLLAQVVLLSALGLWVVWSGQREAAELALPPLRAVPLAVEPLRDRPEVVSDAELEAFLSRLALADRGFETVVGHVDHVLRMWGPEVAFEDPRVMSGEKMLGLLTDHRVFERAYGSDEPPLLIDVEPGVRVRALEGDRSVSHEDHLLATLAEIGTPVSQAVHTPSGPTTVRALLTSSLADFDPQQAEYEWSILAYALYLPPVRQWRTSFGQSIDFDLLAERMMRERLPRGVCSAHHRLYGLTVLLRVDAETRASEGSGILTRAVRDRVASYLTEVTALLVRHQHSSGFWNGQWPLGPPAFDEPSGLPADGLSDRVIATGHALEWWSLAPEELLPPMSVVTAAARWLLDTAAAMSDEEIQRNISFLSHAGRALAGWRGQRPAQAVAVPVSSSESNISATP